MPYFFQVLEKEDKSMCLVGRWVGRKWPRWQESAARGSVEPLPARAGLSEGHWPWLPSFRIFCLFSGFSKTTCFIFKYVTAKEKGGFRRCSFPLFTSCGRLSAESARLVSSWEEPGGTQTGLPGRPPSTPEPQCGLVSEDEPILPADPGPH